VLLINFLIYTVLIKFFWNLTIPDLFPGAVKEGLITQSISWWTVIKIAIFLEILKGAFKIKINIKKPKAITKFLGVSKREIEGD